MLDYAIVGAGPAGLALAQCLSSVMPRPRILVIDRETTVGGCHRVRRKDGLFTEHGPRVYSETYVVFESLLRDVALRFRDFFTPYLTFQTIGSATLLKTLSVRELAVFIAAFGRLLVQPSYGKDESVAHFAARHDFGVASRKLLDRLCRTTDGASAERYTLHSFLQLANAQGLNRLYQPNIALDRGLFPAWQSALEARGVEFMLGVEVDRLEEQSILVDGARISADHIVLAIPPSNMVTLLKQSDLPSAFGDDEALVAWERQTRYLEYISITFHWTQKLTLPDVYSLGFDTDWGLAFIVLSDYFPPGTEAPTLLSVAITRSEAGAMTTPPGTFEIEVLRQLRTIVSVPDPDFMIISPGCEWNGARWINKDAAYVETPGSQPLASRSPNYPWLSNVGTHSGRHLYRFTSLEAAVSNAVGLATDLHPELSSKYRIHRSTTITDYVYMLIVFALLSFVWYRLAFT